MTEAGRQRFHELMVLPMDYSPDAELIFHFKKGVANASFSTAFDLGIGLGAIVLGWVSHYTGYEVLFTISSVPVAGSFGSGF